MLRQHVMCIVKTENEVINLLNELRKLGFMSDDISVLLSDTTSTTNFIYEKHSKAPEGAVQGAGTGGILGGTLGWLASMGTLAIPGAGPFIVAGPLMAALSGLAIGATVGGVTGALVGMGIPAYEAKHYEGKIKEGNALISVAIREDEEKNLVKDILKKAKAQDITFVNEAIGSSSER
ncbi:MAG: hypothetical protein NUV91_05310 [Candidatus Omnitrophica bacterium]|nr:hypothetical protein [Candidatus Omnitrophota bacterium]